MDFTVPAGADDYAPEIYYLTRKGVVVDVDEVLSTPYEVQANIITLPTDAALEMDILRNGADKALEASWSLARTSWTELGLAPQPTPLSQWGGVRFRMRSGGSAGAGEAEVRAV